MVPDTPFSVIKWRRGHVSTQPPDTPHQAVSVATTQCIPKAGVRRSERYYYEACVCGFVCARFVCKWECKRVIPVRKWVWVGVFQCACFSVSFKCVWGRGDKLGNKVHEFQFSGLFRCDWMNKSNIFLRVCAVGQEVMLWVFCVSCVELRASLARLQNQSCADV